MNRSRLLVCFAVILCLLSLLAPLSMALAAPVAPAAANAAANAVPDPRPGLMGQEGLNATAWVQSSTEARIASRQAYRLAARQLDAALSNTKWTASVEQGAGFETLPPAIILDVDETILDNSPYQARLVRDNAVYTSATWEAWVSQAAAPALSGAVPFLNYAAQRGVRIYYVSNRGADEETATRENLKRIGAPIDWRFDAVLLNGEKPDWTSDKTTRRAFIAQTNRVLLIIGDDMNDFVPAKPLTLGQRTALLEKYDAYWGERWILLSNPLYGSWEGALFGYRYDLSRAEMVARKYEALEFGEAGANKAKSPEITTPVGDRN